MHRLLYVVAKGLRLMRFILEDVCSIRFVSSRGRRVTIRETVAQEVERVDW